MNNGNTFRCYDGDGLSGVLYGRYFFPSAAGPAFQESAVIVHAVMDEGMTKVTLGDDSGASSST